METRLLTEGDRSTLTKEGALPPERDRDDPRAGGGVGNEVDDGLLKAVCEAPLWIDPGLREGGGGGPLIDSDEGRLFSNAGNSEESSSGLGDNRIDDPLESFDSATIWLCRRASGGAGGFFRVMNADGDGGSGVFPADSLSNTDSRSESWLALFGAGGRGLLRSVWERGAEVK